MSTTKTASNEALDSELLERVKKAVETASRHSADKDGFRTYAMNNLHEVAHKLSVLATTRSILPPRPILQLSDGMRGIVRRMQAIIEDKPADMTNKLQVLSKQLRNMAVGPYSSSQGNGKLWVPEIYLATCNMASKSACCILC